MPESTEIIREIYRQCNLQYRHAETERFWMLQLYIAVTGAFAALVVKNTAFAGEAVRASEIVVPLVLIHVLYSFLSLCASLKLSTEFVRCNAISNLVLDNMSLGSYAQYPSNPTSIPEAWPSGRWERVARLLLSLSQVVAHLYTVFISADVAFLSYIWLLSAGGGVLPSRCISLCVFVAIAVLIGWLASEARRCLKLEALKRVASQAGNKDLLMTG
jgi:hypothetical protein